VTMYVAGIGARTPFGLDARQTTLALRASMFAPRPSPWRSQRADQVLGSHRSAAIDDAVEGGERLFALALPALSEAIEGLDVASAAFIVALAEPRGPTAATPDVIGRRLVEEAGLRIDRARLTGLRGGHAGMAMAIARAAQELKTGARAAVVGCVDTYHEEAQMRWLDEEHRVLGPHAHNGFVPSEGAAFVVLTRDAPAAGSWCTIEHVEVAFEPEDGDLTKRTFAETATGLLHRAAAATKVPFPWALTDVSNERHRVKEWTALQIRCREALDVDATAVTRLAETGGDSGAASGGLAVVHACAAWRWGFAPADRALVSMQSEGRERGVVVLAAPPTAPPAGARTEARPS
jgi:3-oxoacyl-[acyl-carrier-protein] synthase-1